MNASQQDQPPARTLSVFDMKALCATLDAERRTRKLTWEELAAEINKPFTGTLSIPINVATLRTMQNKRSVTSAVVLQVLSWLGRSPEDFLVGRHGTVTANASLPDAGTAGILRLDTRAMNAALNAKRIEQGLTWKQVADQLQGFTPGTLMNLATGPLIGFPRVMLLTQWLDRPMADFVRIRTR